MTLVAPVLALSALYVAFITFLNDDVSYCLDMGGAWDPERETCILE